jgi:hypothetical protein
MHKTQLTFIAAVVAAAFLSTAAHAGRPLQTEDAGILERAACEIEGATLRVTADGERATENGLGVSCGVGLNSQIGLGLARLRAGGERTRGATLGGKTGLWKSGDGDDASALTLAWGVFAEHTSGGWKHSSTDLNLVASVPVTAGTVQLNLGHARMAASSTRFTNWNVAFEHEGVDLAGLKWAPMAELYGDDHGARWWNIAARWTVVADRIYVDLSYGQQMGGEKARLTTLGFKLAF